MSKTLSTAVVAALIASAALASNAHAQAAPVEAPPPARELDPAKRVPPPVTHDGTSLAAQPHATPAAPVPSYEASQPASAHDAAGRGGFFLGVQGGKGWVYEDVDQSALAVSAGYRWQAGAVTLVGIELAAGALDRTEEDGWRYGKVDYASIGANARFDFGPSSPVHALVRAGYFSADAADLGSVDGGYVGLGLGVDVNRHFNMSLVYTNYVYFNELYWTEDGVYYDAGRADTLMLGAEVRF
jgi:hypothetical protein